MTTLAITSAPMRRLFSLLDFAPQPRDEALARLLDHWRDKRGNQVLPRRSHMRASEVGDAAARMFVYEISGHPRDYALAQGQEAVSALLGGSKAGELLSEAKHRREAVRLRRLFDCVGDEGEPVLAEFVMHEGSHHLLVEILAAPLAGDEGGRPAIFGGMVMRALDADAEAEPHAHPHERPAPVLFALGDSRMLGEEVSRCLGAPLAPHEERDFEDGEHKTRPLVNVRRRDVYVLANLAGDRRRSANDRLCRLLFFIAALKDASAASVTAVVPYLCYGRKDRQTKSRDPVTTRYVAQLFEAMGVDRVITMAAHNIAAFQNAFRCDTDHLDADLLFARHFASIVGDEPVAVVSPDVGGVKRAELLRERLEEMLGRQVGKAFMEKQRSKGKVSGDIFAGDVGGRTVIVLDDMISTGGTMVRMARACKEHGASDIHLVATHGVFSGGAPAILEEPSVTSIVVTDSISPLRLDREKVGERLVVLSVAGLLAQAISRCNAGGSIVQLLERGV